MSRPKTPKPLPPAATPLWSRLAQKLAGAIASGDFPVGSTLPTEHELMTLYGMSRHTVRSALAELVSLGLISRTPHVGTRVISDGKTAQFFMELPEVGDIDRLAADHPRELIGFEKLICSPAVSIETGFPVQTPLIRLEYVRTETAAQHTLAYTTTWLRDTGTDIVPLAYSQNRTPLITVLEQHAGVRCVTIDQSFTAVSLTASQARILGVPEGSAALLLQRNFMDSRRSPIVVAKNYYPQGRFTYTMHVSRRTDADTAG